MKSRIFNTLSLISAILLACTIILWAWSFWTDPRKDCLSFSGDFHVAVQDGRVSFFSDKEYGPYHGSIIALTSPEWPIERIFAEQACFRGHVLASTTAISAGPTRGPCCGRSA